MLIAAAMQAPRSTDPAQYLPDLARVRHTGVTTDIALDDRGDLTLGLLSIFWVGQGKWVLQRPTFRGDL